MEKETKPSSTGQRAAEKRKWATYSEYLDSEEWQQKRAVAFARLGRRCHRCGGRARHIHHKTYRHGWGNEPYEALEPLCASCHQHHHGIEKRSKELAGADRDVLQGLLTSRQIKAMKALFGEDWQRVRCRRADHSVQIMLGLKENRIYGLFPSADQAKQMKAYAARKKGKAKKKKGRKRGRVEDLHRRYLSEVWRKWTYDKLRREFQVVMSSLMQDRMAADMRASLLAYKEALQVAPPYGHSSRRKKPAEALHPSKVAHWRRRRRKKKASV